MVKYSPINQFVKGFSPSMAVNYFGGARSKGFAMLRNAGMYQNCHFLARLGKQSLYVFGSIRLFDEVRAELVRDISRSPLFL